LVVFCVTWAAKYGNANSSALLTALLTETASVRVSCVFYLSIPRPVKLKLCEYLVYVFQPAYKPNSKKALPSFSSVDST